ncbi:MAG TPA: formate dehydrogenase accessory sulfurtransferase FdhD [Thermoanaerobaculia bacterium]|nr:formate dehydrogenase accessory sulfurtransferase FdhD [Thermoanaerobaculia bacterium]
MSIRAKPNQVSTRLWTYREGAMSEREDHLATEEPLEIRLRMGERTWTVAVTMRTPGDDAELAAGFLYNEEVVADRERIRRIVPVAAPEENIVEVELGDGPEPELRSLERHFFATSACGVCGKAGLETLRLRVPATASEGPVVEPSVLSELPDRLRAAQGVFAVTGGLHAAALFDAAGNLIHVREDVGRHNALDKLIGRAFLDGRLPLRDHLVLVSGRASYELLQKCLVAGVPFVCAVSAPSSLAVEVAERFGLTLVGFLRGDRFNIYAGPERIVGAPEEAATSRRRGDRLFPTIL